MRWEKLKNDVQITPKSLSPRDDAYKDLLKAWKHIHDTLKSTLNDNSEREKDVERHVIKSNE